MPEDNAGDAIDAGKAQTSATTATGQEAARRAGAEDDRIDDLESRGSTVPITGNIEPDFLHEGAFKPQGLQAEPAQFVTNGSIPPNHISSNSGLVPVSAVTSSPEEAETRMKQHDESVKASSKRAYQNRRRLSDEEVGKMGASELRAVAQDRGYDFSDLMGARGTRSAFATAQDKDELLSDQNDEK